MVTTASVRENGIDADPHTGNSPTRISHTTLHSYRGVERRGYL
jgi:hypothetical protein